MALLLGLWSGETPDHGEEAKAVPAKPTILIVEDHELFANGLQHLLLPTHCVLAVIPDGERAIAELCEWRPDVVILDLFLPGVSGLRLLGMLHGLLASARIVVLTGATGPGLSALALRSGASAFLTKSCCGAEILHAIDEVLLGRHYVAPLISNDLALGEAESTAMFDLTDRERTVIQLLARGMTNIEIGHLMAISSRGVHFHRSNIRRRLGFHTDAELLRFAVLAQMF